VGARLYSIALSNPAAAAAGMLAHARIPHRVVKLPAGLHPQLVRAAGFPGATVPALELANGRRLQGSLAISRALHELVPERPLFPSAGAARRAVEDAEHWGHGDLQSLPRRLLRWALVRDRALRRWVAADVLHWPAPALVAELGRPLAWRLARVADAQEPVVRNDLRRLPALLDRVDELLGAGTIGAAEPNAADFQILSSVRVVLEFTDLADLVEGRPCAAQARRLFPRWDGPIPASPALERVS